jgi:hypothetical protein
MFALHTLGIYFSLFINVNSVEEDAKIFVLPISLIIIIQVFEFYSK